MLALAAMALAAPGAMALEYADMNAVGGYGPYQAINGGEFTLRISAAQADSGIVAGNGAGSTWSFYDSKTRSQVLGSQNEYNFQTFCAEGSAYIYSGQPVDVTIADSTKFENKPLSVGAAWIYAQFASGQLADDGYAYAGGTAAQIAARKDSAWALQNTIWWLMGTEGYGKDTPAKRLAAAPNNVYTTLVKSTFAGTSMFDDNAGLYGVAVVRLWADGDAGRQLPGNDRQDQLVLTTQGGNKTPDGGFTLALLGMSLTGLGALRRRFKPAR